LTPLESSPLLEPRKSRCARICVPHPLSVCDTLCYSWAAMPNPILAVHLAENTSGARRSLTTGRAYPLGELDRPTRASATAAELERIVRYLNVEAHARYARTPSNTFCNVYAYDYCYLAGVYLPRVWWTSLALMNLAAGQTVPAKYGITVQELNANALYVWLRDHGAAYVWTRAASLDQLQTAANAGQVSLICAQRTVLSKPGHIAAVVPESAPPQIAERTGTQVRLPLQSMAGARNFCFSCVPGKWWEGAQFQAFGFWIHP